MPSPLGWDRRHERGLIGLLARWWGAHRVRRIKKAMRRNR
jgi:hypothetical protein